MAGRRLHPLAEAALRAAGKAGRKALEQAALEGISAAADSVLEDVENSTGGLSEKAKEARAKIQQRKEETMAKRKKRAAEEEDLEEEEEEEDEDDAEEEDDEDGDETFVVLNDAEAFSRNVVYNLEALLDEKKVDKSLVKRAQALADEISELLDEYDE